MSNTKKIKGILFTLFSIISFFAFGCKNSNVAINNISINIENQSQIVLMVDEFFDFEKNVEISPTYATDKSFSVISNNEDVVRVVGHQIKAVSAGETFVRVVSNSNSNVEDVISVIVRDGQEQLSSPTALSYNSLKQEFTFNMVDNAVSYTININDVDFEIGNVNTFKLSSYAYEKYNNVLSVKIKANGPKYTRAYQDSPYSNTLKVYQTSSVNDAKVVGGKLLFEVEDGLVYDVYWGDLVYRENLTTGEISLSDMSENFSGTSGKIYVMSKPSESTKLENGNNVVYESAKSNEIVVNVLDESKPQILGSVLTWESVAFSSGYEIFINNEKVASTNENCFDLKGLPQFDNIAFEDGEVEIYVSSIVGQTSVNIAKTTKVQPITFAKLSTPVLKVGENGISWNQIENSAGYYIEIKQDGVTIFNGNTALNYLDLTKLNAGNYTISLYATGKKDVDCYFISSRVVSKTITKHSKVNAKIENYVLSFNTTAGEKYSISFDIDDNNSYNQQITAVGNSISLDLSVYNFKAGEHVVTISRMGNGDSIINSEVKTLSFVQFEATTVSIANSLATVRKSSVNQNAEFYIEITGGDLENPIKVQTDSYSINTTNTDVDYLSAGEYSIVAYVCGDGSSTFSYRNLKQEIPCGQINFVVLDVPSLSILDFDKSEISVNEVDRADNYSILDVNNMVLGTVENKYPFTLTSGERCEFKVRANGNGSSILSSLNSDVLKVERLVTPELIFDSATNSLQVEYNNDDKLYNNEYFTFEGLAVDYTYGEEFTDLMNGKNNFEFGLISKGKIDDVLYLNSLPVQIVVHKLDNTTTDNRVSVNSENKLHIKNPENGTLMLKFSFDSSEYIADDGKIANLDYVISSKDYFITLLDANFNAIIEEMAMCFGVSFKFVKQDSAIVEGVKTYFTNSDWSEQVELELNPLTAASEIYTDESNKIVVENENSDKAYIDLKIDINGTILTFEDNGRNQLVGKDYTLNYTYSNNKYYIDLYESGHIQIEEIEQGNSFGVLIKFRKTLAGSDIDSNYSEKVNIQYLQSPTFERNAQLLSFVSVLQDYTLDNYGIDVNGTTIRLNGISSVFTVSDENGLNKYTANMANLYNALKTQIPTLVFTDINSLALVTLNVSTTKTNRLLGSLGSSIYVQQANTFEIKTVKTDGLISLQFQSATTEYAKSYTINVVDTEFINNDGSTISIELDSLIGNDDFIINGYVSTTGNYTAEGKLVYVFNSELSNSVEISRLAAPVLDVEDNYITYTTIPGATQYEIYKLSTSNTYVKVEETEIERNGTSFKFKDLQEVEEFKVAVKAVNSNNTILNSYLSEEIIIKKMGVASSYVSGGMLKLSLPNGCVDLIKSGNVQAVVNLKIDNKTYRCIISQDLSTTLAGVKWDSNNNVFNISTTMIFNGSKDYIVEQNVETTLELDGEIEGIHYIHSDSSTTKVLCLFAPTGVVVDKTDASIQKISWQNNEKNKLSSTGDLIAIDEYLMVFKHNDVSYYSNDGCLKYLSNGNYVSYQGITSTNIAFPYGYDENNDGDFNDELDVVFGAGGYYISIAAIADGYIASLNSSEYYFTIMEKPVLDIADGMLIWASVPGADNYVLRISSGSKIELEKEISELYYNFDDFNGVGLYSVTVQAKTSQTNMLNSQESDSMSIVKFNSATSVRFDNGKIRIVASPYVHGIEIEFDGKTFTFINFNQDVYFAELEDVSEITDKSKEVIYEIGLTESVASLANVTGKIKVKLLGNNSTKSVLNLGKIGLINSKAVEHQTNAVVLGTNVNTVSSGVWKFSQNTNLGQDNKTTINYNFNNVSSINSFWLDAIVYKITIDTYGQGEVKNDVIYAVDYYRFIDSGLTTNTSNQTYYELCDDLNGLYARIVYVTSSGNLLYLNVYEYNIIDLQNYDELYYYPMTDNKNFTYSSVNELKSIDLATGGAFKVGIGTLGGDEMVASTYSYLNSPMKELPVFARYGQSYLSTQGGQLVFADLSNTAAVSPVYHVSVSKWNDDYFYNVYLYDAESCTEEQVRIKFGLTDVDKCEPIKYIEETNQIAFEMSEYFGAGVYATYVRAMAGVGADDYLLNAKIPESPYVVKVLTSTNPTLSNGNLTFDLSYVNVDGLYVYSYDYEIVIEHNNLEYVYQINGSSDNVLIEGVKLTYTMPNQIDSLSLVSGNNYKLKVRALANSEGVLNAQFYDGNSDGKADYLSFTRETPVSNVRIEDGVLKWTGVDENSYYEIKINYFNQGYKTIKITEGYSKSGANYSYEFTEDEYAVQGFGIKSQILPGVNYTISVSRLGNNTDTISSLYVDCENVFRLTNLGSSQILASSGELTWTDIAGALGYKLEMVGNRTYTFTINSNTNSIDFVTTLSDEGLILPSGEYIAKIRVLGNDKINSLLTTSDLTFKKLSTVTNVQILGEKIVWEGVDAQAYVVKFSYNGKTAITTVYENEVSVPNDVQGILTAEITSCGGNSTTLLNSDTLEIKTSKETPGAVTNLKYNNELNRFEWKTQDDFVNTDILHVAYDLIEYSASGNIEHETESLEILFKQDEYYDADNDVYYFPVTIMGIYNNFTVCVQRSNAVNSPALSTSENVQVFSYGGGTSENPYVLNSEQSLLNIRYYPTAHYKLISDIEITGAYTSSIVSVEFAGTILGETKEINFGNVNLTNVSEFALFKSLSGAKIYNLDIMGNITNRISSVETDVNIALLAINSNSSTFANVRIIASTISILENEQNSAKEISGNLYLAGMVSQDKGSTLTDCSVVLTTYVDIDTNDIYLAGISSISEQTMVTGGAVSITISSAKNTIQYFGGAVAYYVGNSVSRNVGFVGVDIEISVSNIKILRFGGVCGYAKHALFESNTITGNISRYAITGDVFFGGVVGVALSSVLYNNEVDANIEITIQTIAGTQRIGKVVGSLETDGNTNLVSELKGKYSTVNEQTALITNSSLTLGLLGYKATGTIIDRNFISN